jgi:hypothetical protein
MTNMPREQERKGRMQSVNAASSEDDEGKEKDEFADNVFAFVIDKKNGWLNCEQDSL